MGGIVDATSAFHTPTFMQARDAGDTETDEALMLAWQAGNAAAFDRIYERHRGGVFRYLLRHCRDRATAEELHQDVWLKLIAARARFDAAARFTTWLYSVARNRMIDHWRRNAAQRLVSLDDDGDGRGIGELLEDSDPAGNPQRAATVLQESALLVAALEALPAAQRDAFLLHVEGGLAVGEIAALTSTPAETVKSRLRYAYKRLRASLGDPA
jgi:RNA polymerase sigma-70 factor (ECF subfamily)